MKNQRVMRRCIGKNLLGGKCSKCGSTEGLEFDHIVPSTKEFTLATNWDTNPIRLLSELRKCQLLCKSCHVGKTLYERGLSFATHGNSSFYMNQGCRCVPCTNAHAQRTRELRKLRRLRMEA